MQRSLLRQLLFPLMLLLAATGAARAETVKLTGAHFDVYYDAAYWDGAALAGDTINLIKPIEFVGIPGIEWYTEFASSLELVAHSGYAFSGDFTVAIAGSYTFPTAGSNSAAGIEVGALVFGSGPDDFLGAFGAGTHADASDSQGGAFAPAGPTTGNVTPGAYTTVRLAPILSLLAAPRLTTTSLDAVSVTAGVVALAVVPEPETSAMLLSGILLLGACVRQRRRL